MEKLFELIQDQPLALITFGVALAIIVAVRHLGILQGLKADPATSASTAQVAAMIIDPTALNAASAEVKGLATAINQATAVTRLHLAATERLAERVDELDGGIDKLRDQMIMITAKL